MRCFPLAAVIAAALMVTLTACKANPPGKLETKFMTTLKQRVVIGGGSQHNPLGSDAATVSDGKEAFSHYCAACHGLDGQNTGVPFADRMSPPVPVLSGKSIQAYSDGQLKWVIDNGIWPSGMPASKGILSDDEIWSIVIYLRHLPAAGSLGEPEMYSH